jgi:hypothetical protein
MPNGTGWFKETLKFRLTMQFLESKIAEVDSFEQEKIRKARNNA